LLSTSLNEDLEVASNLHKFSQSKSLFPQHGSFRDNVATRSFLGSNTMNSMTNQIWLSEILDLGLIFLFSQRFSRLVVVMGDLKILNINNGEEERG
jgi:hypothetical protein